MFFSIGSLCTYQSINMAASFSSKHSSDKLLRKVCIYDEAYAIINFPKICLILLDSLKNVGSSEHHVNNVLHNNLNTA